MTADSRPVFRAMAGGAAAIAGLAACQVLLGIDDPDTVARPPDAGADAAMTTCAGEQPPAQVGSDTGVGQPLFFALKTLSTLRDGRPAGYNVDHHCTFADADLPCVGSPDDADGGIDNALQNLIIQLPGGGGADPFGDDVNSKIASGREGVFLALYHYSGQPDDGEIQLGMVSAPSLAGTDCDAAAPDAGPVLPKWDGCDVWSLGDTSLANGDALPTAQHGYVAGGTVVVRYSELRLQIGVLMLHIVNAVVTARVVSEGSGWSLVDGVVGGRLRADEFIQEASELVLHGLGQPVCHLYPTELRDAVCRGRDLRVNDDNPSAACDGLSVGFTFEARAVALGVRGDAAPGPVCPPLDTHCP